MTHHARRAGTLYCGWAVLILLLAAGAAAWAQPAPPTPPGSSPPASPAPPTYEPAPAGEPGAPAPESEEEEGEEGFNPWLDWVHAIGITGGGLMVTNFLIGLSIFFGARAGTARFPVRKRKGRRKWHYVFGLTALALAASHALLRFVQIGTVDLGNPPAFLLACIAVLLALSGMVRAWPPRRLARYPQVWTWVHRTLTTLAVVFLTWHVAGQIQAFLA